MKQLEGVNSIMVIIDLKGCRSIKRLNNIYRSFNPQDNVNARAKFRYQLELIKNAMTSKCVIVSDFNMDLLLLNVHPMLLLFVKLLF